MQSGTERHPGRMLPYRRFPLCRLLPSWWMLPWALALPLLLDAVFPHPAPVRAEGLEWPVHDGGPCLGDEIGLSMPPLEPQPFTWPGAELPYLPLPRLDQIRPWRTVEFTGQPLTDFMGLRTSESYLRALAADTAHAGGVRLRFGPRVSYACFFEVMAQLRATGQRRYWLDVRRCPATVYCVTPLPNHPHAGPPVVPTLL